MPCQTQYTRASLVRDVRGAAMVEGVILLPFFIIVFAGVYFMHGVYSAKISTAVKARECAWAYANSGCDESNQPAGCDFSSPQHAQLTPMQEVQGADRSEFEESVGKISGEMSGFVDDIMQLGDGTTATASSPTPRPSVLGGGRSTTASRFTVMCNEKNREPLDVVKAAYCMLGDLPGCGD